MQVIYSKDKQTIKYKHEDGSETSLKMELSGKFDADLNLSKTDNNKYSLVLSCSSGCQMSCSFCHLTNLEKPYKKLTKEQVVCNVEDVLHHALLNHPELATRNLKLCWMGEGEPWLNSELITLATLEIYKFAKSMNYCAGLDGVDIATCVPRKSRYAGGDFIALKAYTDQWHSRDDRSSLRLFYSLHSSVEDIRKLLVPKSAPVNSTGTYLENICEQGNIDLVLHVTFIDGVNDSQEHVKSLISYVRSFKIDPELRILRYNPFDSTTKESKNIKQICNTLKDMLPKVKIQYSSGEEIKSACGMFTGN